MKLPDAAARNAYIKDLEQKKVVTPAVLKQITALAKSGISSSTDPTAPIIPNGTKTSSSNIIDKVLTYAHAIGTDPSSAFHDIFTGQSIKAVEKGQILVDRMSYAQSSADKADISNAQGMILDHIVPLEAGGTNDKSNLQVISAEADGNGVNQPIEDFLGQGLKAGKITGAQAREAAIRFKAGQGQPLTPELQEYKDKYGGKPMTADQVYNLQF